jgi:hypothetical protein
MVYVKTFQNKTTKLTFNNFRPFVMSKLLRIKSICLQFEKIKIY